MAPSELLAVAQQVAEEFPLSGHWRGVMLLDQDPVTLQVHWLLDRAEIGRARRTIAGTESGGRLVLRLRKLGFAALDQGAPDGLAPTEVVDQEIREPQGRVQLAVSAGGGNYEAEIGVEAADGGWLSLGRSNRIVLPASGSPEALVHDTLDLSRSPLTGERGATGGQGAPAAPEEPAIASDPSLRGGGVDILEPVFPNTAPIRGGVAGEQEPLQTIAADVPIRPPLPEAETRAEMRAALACWSSHGLAADPDAQVQLQAELRIYGQAPPGTVLRLFGVTVTADADGRFQLIRALDPEFVLDWYRDGAGGGTAAGG